MEAGIDIAAFMNGTKQSVSLPKDFASFKEYLRKL